MTLRVRKRLVVGFLIGVVLLANATLVVQWLQHVGLIDLARWIRREYVTGTALAVIAVLLWLLSERDTRGVESRKLCRVCDRFIAVGGRYCPHCGSRT
jgi:hypothetical protein